MLKRFLFLAVSLFVLGVSLYAQTTGRLQGTVRDEQGNPVAYANVILQGTSIGQVTDDRGRYTIINIPPGTYTVIVSAVGYARIDTENVRISVDETRTLDVRVPRASVEMETIVVKAETELITRGQAQSVTKISADDIANTTVTDVDGLLAMTAGVSRGPDGSLNVRGGRANEMVMTVDGMSVSDPVDGGRALSVDLDAIADMRVMTGGFTAEYGNAQSGMVNIVTKDGTEKWEGKIEAITDHLFNNKVRDDIFTDSSNYDEVKFALGGPVPVYFFNNALRSKFTFFLNGAAAWDDTRYRKLYRNTPQDDFAFFDSNGNYKRLLDTDYDTYDPYQSRDEIAGMDIGNRNSNNYNLNLKTSLQINPTQKLTLALRGDRALSYPYSHSSRYALQHFIETESQVRQYLVTYDHVFNPKTTLQLKASYYNKIVKQNPRGINTNSYILQYDLDDPDVRDTMFNPRLGQYGYYRIDEQLDREYSPGIYPGFPSLSHWVYNFGQEEAGISSYFSAPGSIWDNFIDDESSQYSVKADFEYQVSQVVGAKTGFEVIQHDIQKNQLGSFLVINEQRRLEFLKYYCTPVDSFLNDIGLYEYEYTPDDYLAAAYAASGARDGYRAKPMQFAYYAQTTLDWEGMIVNAGLRADMWYLGKDYDILKEDGSYRKRQFDNSDRFQLMLSPRLGVSHPISERDVIHFAYNYQNQLPAMRYIFTSVDTMDARSNPGTRVGNPGLEPQITITYEVGLQHLWSEDYVSTVTVYFKNIYNYISTRKVVSETAGANWYEYISEDYGSARGVDFTLNRRLHNFIMGGLNYSLAWANGNNSEVVIQDTQTSLREFPLDWDIRHQFNFNTTFLVRKGEEFIVPFTDWVLPFSDFSVSFSYNISSGRPYTPISQDVNKLLETNSKRMPAIQSADMRISKNFSTGKDTFIRTYFSIENLFKTKNIYSVYGRTGSPYYDGADLSEIDGYTWPEKQFMHDLAIRNPGMTHNDRNYIFGISYNF